jgi:hypothetical protein
MREWDYQELRSQQAELAALGQILDEYKAVKKPDLYIKHAEMTEHDTAGLGDFAFVSWDFIRQQSGLKSLEEKGIIRIVEESSLQGIHLTVIQPSLLEDLYEKLHESIPALGSAARIIYSTKTGRGKMNGIPFQLYRNTRNRKVFEYLIKHPKKELSKQKLWQIAGEKGKFAENDADMTIQFNTIITTLRQALKNVSPEYLRLKTEVFLDADVTLTD